ncbi:unnamed protein product [Adineta steineri]|uniref:PARP catalytic domain-containing protein n=1 Tax=Adineta steineri TaxID=433720 RepID=A0A813SMN9_9BILA|nr:unnamed protein product [Adineta steineri]CAF3995815.1 unnamed protein product [Adineta steineri]
MIALADKWNDEHGYGIIDLIRYSVVDRLENNRQCPLTLFDTSCDKEWIEQIFDSVRDSELSYTRRLQIYTSNDGLHNSAEKDLQNSMSIFIDKATEEQMFFYHGPTAINAQLIISRGIHLHLRASRPGDFGFGFYTTNNLVHALRHAENRANKTDGEQRPACLIFSISKNEFNSYQIVRLLYAEKQEQITREKMNESLINSNNIFEWHNFVYQCLNNDPPLPLIYNKDAIIGPISANLKDSTLRYKAIKQIRIRRQIPIQTAIISMKLAFALFDGLKGHKIFQQREHERLSPYELLICEINFDPCLCRPLCFYNVLLQNKITYAFVSSFQFQQHFVDMHYVNYGYSSNIS